MDSLSICQPPVFKFCIIQTELDELGKYCMEGMVEILKASMLACGLHSWLVNENGLD